MSAHGTSPATLQRDNAIHFESGSRALGELLEQMEQRLAGAGQGRPLVLVGSDALSLVGAAAWLAAGGRDGVIVDRERLTPALQGRLAADGYAIVDAGTGRALAAGAGAFVPGRVRILTSGTTGEPKLVGHTWESLFTMARVKRPAAARWLLTYQPGTYAWYQVVTCALFMPEQELILPGGAAPADMLRRAAEHGATAISATPTFWRIALLHADPGDVERLGHTLTTATLGGELVDQAILDRLRRRFPAARVVHIYASTEAGAAIVVGDGMAGFPREWLDDDARSPQLRLREGRLWIRSRHAATGITDWWETGDLAEIRGDRVFLLGRADRGVINVGGAKAWVADIEGVLSLHPDVRWCRVRGRRAPLVGELVTADVVLETPSASQAAAEQRLTAWCGERLPPHMVPRVWNVLDEIPIAANWKSEG